MLSTKAINDAMMTLVAADPATLAPATAGNKVALVVQPFTPDPNLTPADLVLATFTGSTPLVAGVGAQVVAYDPLAACRFIQIKEPSGGWYWHCTAAPASPETVYGVALLDDLGTKLLGMTLFDSPVQIKDVDDSIQVGSVRMYQTGQGLT